jgi:hypothetical protein
MLYVYFIQAGERGPIKIGITQEPEARRDELQIGSPVDLVLLAAHPGTPALERALHRRFTEGNLRGEWFRPDTPGLAEEIQRAVHLEALALDACRGCCRECGRPIVPPRTRLCGVDCEREQKRARSAAWRTAKRTKSVRFDVPTEEGESDQ